MEPLSPGKWKTNGFFSKLSAESLLDFEALKHSGVYPAGTILFFEQQVSRGVFVLRSGEIKLTISSRAGKRLTLKIANEGDILGLIAAVTGNLHETTAETLNPCQVAFVHRDDFLRFIAEHPEAAGDLVHQVCSSYLDTCERLRTLVLPSSTTERLARLLLRWSADGEDTDQGREIKLPWTQGEIAEFIGSSRETVTRILSMFRQRQFIALKGSTLIVSNRSGLESLSGD